MIVVACLYFVALPSAFSQVTVSSALGNSFDPLAGANSFFVAPGESRFSRITVANNPFDQSKLTAPVQITVRCCVDTGTGDNVNPVGVTLKITPSICRDTLRGPSSLPTCPAQSGAVVNVTPTDIGTAFLQFTADDTAATTLPGGLTATVVASWLRGHRNVEAAVDVRLSVVPSAWPADGAVSTCFSGLSVVPLGSITPNPFSIKRSNPGSTTFSVGVAFDSTGPAAGSGLEFLVGPSPTPNLIFADRTTVNFVNTKGRPVGIRTVDSRNCTAQGPPLVVREGQTLTLSFESGSATTLVLSKSTCRAWVDWFDCWNQSALGMDDIVVLSEAPFWPLFGNHTVNIRTVGDWGALRRPDSVAIIRTP